MARLGRAQPFPFRYRPRIIPPAGAATTPWLWYDASQIVGSVSVLRKNVASQVLTFNLVNATTGAALTGATVTTKVTLDGTQSASAGVLTELGTGQYKYVPTQAETNGASVGCSFTATNAVPVNLHCFTIGQDPALTTFDTNPIKWNGTAVSASATAGIPEVNVKNINNVSAAAVTTVKAVQGLTTADVIESVTGAVGSVTGAVGSVTAGVTLAAAAVQAIWDALTAALTTVGSIGKKLTDNIDVVLSTRSSASALATVQADTDDIQTRLPAALDANGFMKADVEDWKGAAAPAMTGDAFARLGAPAGASVSADIAAVKTKVDFLSGTPATVADIPTTAQIADKVLGRNLAAGSDGGRTVQDALRFSRNKFTIVAGVLTVYKEDDVTVAWTAVITTTAGDPVSASDPA